ncbi:golgin subfamily A member 6-like protein 22 isoform X2 [Crassostrea angulata]|uniref:golgin subfamily A member 6-like protein 22 isoform X2 n=1 Tax=Magallana angulata TaxID=2784310 RepID=UPI0022B20C91|nr:golgin subfamily A member 6-like protein 22 isoform X2 [Crassostrea angulata]
MLSEYNRKSRLRPRSAQSPRPYRVYTYNNDYYGNERPKRCKWNDVGITRSSYICKSCVDLRLEKTELIHENDRLQNRVETMLKKKETEVWNEVSITLDELYRENTSLKEKISVEERRRISEISSIPYDPVACIRGRYYRSLEENTELERKLKHKEKEVWDLKEILEETESKLKWLREVLTEKEINEVNMRQKIIAGERNLKKCFEELKKSRKECDIFWASCQQLTDENTLFRVELEETRRSLFSSYQQLKDENTFLRGELEETRRSLFSSCEQLTNENTLLKEELKETKRICEQLTNENTVLKEEARRMLSRNEYSPTEIHKRIQSITEEYQKQKDNIKHQNAGIVAPWKLDSQYSFPAERDDMEMRKRIDYLEKENKRLNSSNMETEVIKRFKEEASNKEKEIRRLQEQIKKEERKSAQLLDLSGDSKRKDSLLQRKDSELQELLHENQRLQNEVTRIKSEKSRQLREEIKLLEIERELNIRKTEIGRLHERIKQLENENIFLQNEKDRHDLHARNSNAADEVKILQTEAEGKKLEIQRLQDKCSLHENENKDLQKKHSKVLEERDNLFQRNQRLQDEFNKLNVKIRHLEENRMETTDEWKHLEETKDTVKLLEKDNDRLNQNIDTLSKEKDSALSRYFEAEENMRHLQLDIKSKGEEIQRLQKQVTLKQGDNEKLQESLSNISKEKQQLVESNKQLEKVNGKMLLAMDESKRWQEKIKELQNEIRDLRHDLSKQKEGATKRISDLESVNANYNDQLLLATTESKRLQGRIKDLQSENSRLRRDIDDLSKQKEDALTRLSKVAGAKLTHGNAAITDLSDTDRPTKLAEKFSELYDNAWTDAFEELDNTFHNEEETIKVLLRIFQEAYKFCVETENNYETRIGQAVFTLASKTVSHQIKNENVEIKKVLADLRISLSPACCSVIEEMVLSKLPSILKSIDVAACPLTKLYARQCASLSWKMRIRDPPLFVRFEFRCGSTFNADVLKRYTKTGGYLDFLVWPTLYLQENGPVLAKGVAQPKIAP